MNTTKRNKSIKIEAYLPLFIFYLVAVACRIVSVCILPTIVEGSKHTIWLQLCEGIGPALGAVIVTCCFKRKWTCTIAGKSWRRSVFCFTFPIALFLILDRTNGLKTTLLFLGCTLYAFFEEVGWRGYLTGEFSKLNQLKRVIIITIFWFIWHINFPFGVHGLIFFAILLLASWGLDQVAHDTHALILCACLHGIFNLFKHNNGILNNYLTPSLLILSIASWFIVWYYPCHKKSSTK